jgi:hypothetical protein
MTFTDHPRNATEQLGSPRVAALQGALAGTSAEDLEARVESP